MAKILEYAGSFMLAELHEELLNAGVAVRTVVGEDNEDEPYSKIQVYVADDVRKSTVTVVVELHDVTKIMADRAERAMMRGSAKVSAEAKLRAFYTTEVGMSDEEIDALIR